MDPYAVLGIKITSGREDIEEAFRRLELRYNPNNVVTGDQVRYEDVCEAYIRLTPQPKFFFEAMQMDEAARAFGFGNMEQALREIDNIFNPKKRK